MKKLLTLLTVCAFWMTSEVSAQFVAPCDSNVVVHYPVYTCDSTAVYEGNTYALGSHILNGGVDSSGCDITLILQVQRDISCDSLPPCDTLALFHTIYTCDSLVSYRNRTFGYGNYIFTIYGQVGQCDSTMYLTVLRDTACGNCVSNILVEENIYTCDSGIVYLNNNYTLGNYVLNVPATSGGCDTTVYLNVLRDSTCLVACDSTLSTLQYYIQDDSLAYSTGAIIVVPQTYTLYRLSNPTWGMTGLSTNPTYTNLPVGTYLLTAIDTLTGCTGYIELEVVDMFAGLRTAVDFPDAFTPNFDGENDVFRPIVRNNSIGVQTFEIYDSAGRLMYESNALEAGWDGTYRGEEMPRGVFIAVLKYTLPSGEVKVQRTSFMLIR